MDKWYSRVLKKLGLILLFKSKKCIKKFEEQDGNIKLLRIYMQDLYSSNKECVVEIKIYE